MKVIITRKFSTQGCGLVINEVDENYGRSHIQLLVETKDCSVICFHLTKNLGGWSHLYLCWCDVAGTWWSSQGVLDDSDTNLNIKKVKYIDNPLKLK